MIRFNVHLIVLLIVIGPAWAAPGAIDGVLERQRQHGFTSPTDAADELLALRGDLAGAPPELRMRYHNQLAFLHICEEHAQQVKAELNELERMATVEKCVPCGQYKTVRLAQ